MTSPRGPSNWNQYCYSAGPLGKNDVADPNCHDITDAGNPKLYSPWEGIWKGKKLVGVKRDCLAADEQYIANLKIKDKIVHREGNGDPGIWLTVGAEYPEDQITINVDKNMSDLALGYIRKKLDENLPVSVGVNVADLNSHNVNGAYVDHWLALDGYRVDDQDKVIQLFATDNAAGKGAIYYDKKDSAGYLEHGYRIQFLVKSDGLIVKEADWGLNPTNFQGHDDIEVEYQIAVVEVYVKDVRVGKGAVLEADGIPMDIWGVHDSTGKSLNIKRDSTGRIPNRKRPFTLKDWKRLNLPALDESRTQ